MISLPKIVIITTLLVYTRTLNRPVESRQVASIQEVISFKMTNLRCDCVDKIFCQVELCRLRVVNRTQINAFVNISILRRPITNCGLNFELFRKTSMLKYNSFPINVTFDGCSFIKNQAKFPHMSYIYDIVRDYTNMNHTCPYHEEYIYIINAGPNNHPYFAFIPEGEYLVKIRFIIDGAVRFIANLYMQRQNLKRSPIRRS